MIFSELTKFEVSKNSYKKIQKNRYKTDTKTNINNMDDTTNNRTKITAIGYLTTIGYLNNTKRTKYNMILHLYPAFSYI